MKSTDPTLTTGRRSRLLSRLRSWLPRPGDAPAFVAAPRTSGEELRLHVGCGREHLEGWTNIDVEPLPGVDVVTDVTAGLHFENVRAVYAEHLLEHLQLDGALRFLLEVHRVLCQDAWLRLSTPNLDWVWSTHYRLDAADPDRHLMALRLNRAFHGWHHRFVWNQEMLELTLDACGFVELRWCAYGQSELELFQGIERHETYGDSPELPHVLIVEAKKGAPKPRTLGQLQDLIEEEFLTHVRA